MREINSLFLGLHVMTEARGVNPEPTATASATTDKNSPNKDVVAHRTQTQRPFYCSAMQPPLCFPGPPSVGEAGTNDIYIEAYDEVLDLEDSVQFGSDGDDLVTAIAADEDIQNDFVIVGSTSSEDDHLFPTQINSSEL